MNNQISERRIRNNRYKRKRQLRQQFLFLFMTILFIGIFSLLGFSMKAKAQSTTDAENIQYKYYMSVQVEAGDTLWDYAKLYANNTYYKSYKNYIEEVVQINSLSNDEITTGQYIILPYYSNEFIN